MFDHVGLWVSDRAASEQFYATVFAPLGIEPTYSGADYIEWDDFALGQTDDAHPVTRGLHVGFVAPSRAEVDEFWRLGTQAGYRDDGPPGLRPEYADDYYGSFLLDPDGNSAEAVHGSWVGPPGNIDHLWFRVADVAAAKRFYELIAPHTGFQLGADTRQRAGFRRGRNSFSVVAGDAPTEHLHLAFGATDDATVEAFHRDALAAGYPDNGAPGERPEYHPGYYAAYVLDPDGNNIELVNHHRG